MKKFDNYKSNLSVLVRADSQDTGNEYSGTRKLDRG